MESKDSKESKYTYFQIVSDYSIFYVFWSEWVSGLLTWPESLSEPATSQKIDSWKQTNKQKTC